MPVCALHEARVKLTRKDLVRLLLLWLGGIDLRLTLLAVPPRTRRASRRVLPKPPAQSGVTVGLLPHRLTQLWPGLTAVPISDMVWLIL